MADSFAIGDPVPAFSLTDTEGAEHVLPAADAPPATVIVQTCNHCPYVIAWNPRLRSVAEEYGPRGVRFLAVSSNDPTSHPADSPERMAQFVRDQDWPIPYAYDGSQDVARALGAERTPEVFVLDGEQRLAYHGAPDADHQDPVAGCRLAACRARRRAGRRGGRTRRDAGTRLHGQMVSMTTP